jgi:hypothetical protein
MVMVVGRMFDQAPWMIVHASHFVHMWSIVKEKWPAGLGHVVLLYFTLPSLTAQVFADPP